MLAVDNAHLVGIGEHGERAPHVGVGATACTLLIRVLRFVGGVLLSRVLAKNISVPRGLSVVIPCHRIGTGGSDGRDD
jgi:hypothetical protein